MSGLCEQSGLRILRRFRKAPRGGFFRGPGVFFAMRQQTTSQQRVNFYIDGFNFYHRLLGLLDAAGIDYRWLDYRKLCASLLKPNEVLGEVFFFTAIPRHFIKSDPEKIRRHKTVLSALKSRGVRVVEGVFRRKIEKMTDVAIASQMLADAYEDKFDICFLLSADSDFVPAIRAVRRRANKTVGLITPPRQGEVAQGPPMSQLRKSVSRSAKGAPMVRNLRFSDLNGCGLPPIIKSRGKTIRKPDEYAVFEHGAPRPVS